MRNKFAVLAILLIVALAAASVGYAYWTDEIHINGTAQAGTMSVDWINNPWNHPSTTASAYVTQGWEIEGKTLKVTFGNLYPGAQIHWQGWGMNSGTIPVKFNRVDIDITDDEMGLADHLFVVPTRTYISWDQDGNGPIAAHDAVSPVWGGYDNFKFADLDDAINGVAVPSFPNLYAVDKFVMNPATDPSDWRTAGRFALGNVDDPEDNCITLKVNPEAGNEIQGASVTFTIDLVFDQFNAP
jgi:predicted ribosomally synthesized peptide with SipW-like signal peptide